MPRFQSDDEDNLYSDLTAAFEASESGVLTSSNLDTWEPPARNTEAAADEGDKPQQGGELGSPPNSEQTPDERRRDERGRFAEGGKEQNPDGGEAPKPGAAPASVKPDQQGQQQAEGAQTPPVQEPAPEGISGTAAQLWREASQPVRDYIRRTEAALGEVAEPLRHVMTAAKEVGVPWSTFVTNLVKGEASLRRDPMYAIEWLASRHGVDLEALADMAAAKRIGVTIPGQQQQQPNGMNRQPDGAIVQEIQQLRQRLDSQEQARADNERRAKEQRDAAFKSEFDAFLVGKDDWSKVGAAAIAQIPIVRNSMPNGTPTQILNEAYNRARWADPEIRAQVQASERRKEEERQRHTRSARLVQQTGHRGMPTPRSGGGDNEDMSVDQTVRSAWAELEAR